MSPTRVAPPAHETDIARELVAAVSQLRRALRREVRRRFPMSQLRMAQVELLRVVIEQPGISVHMAAEAMQVADNTVSTLVNELTEAGLLRRTVDPSNRRVARLDLTSRGRRRVAALRDRREQIAASALERLDQADQQAIADAMPALRRLIDVLEP